jgi:anti-sigma B factor antagonist
LEEPKIAIAQRTVEDVTVVAITGEIDGNTAPEVQAQIVPLVAADAKIVLDMTGVSYMSSAGLRVLLVIYRRVAGQGGTVVLVGLSQDLEDTMSLTGFLEFFDHYKTVDEGVAALR